MDVGLVTIVGTVLVVVIISLGSGAKNGGDIGVLFIFIYGGSRGSIFFFKLEISMEFGVIWLFLVGNYRSKELKFVGIFSFNFTGEEIIINIFILILVIIIR